MRHMSPLSPYLSRIFDKHIIVISRPRERHDTPLAGGADKTFYPPLLQSAGTCRDLGKPLAKARLRNERNVEEVFYFHTFWTSNINIK